eukprot:27597-Chlamydomonas_euryale.AAC.2
MAALGRPPSPTPFQCERKLTTLGRPAPLLCEWQLTALDTPSALTAFGTLGTPWPMPNVDVVACALGADCLDEHGAVYIEMVSPKEVPVSMCCGGAWASWQARRGVR